MTVRLPGWLAIPAVIVLAPVIVVFFAIAVVGTALEHAFRR